jgi:hypothetical protein
MVQEIRYKKADIHLSHNWLFILYYLFPFCWDGFLPASPKAEAGLGIAFSVRPSFPARQYLLSVICNSNSFQSILFKLCTVFVYILKMWTSYYGLIWRFFFIYFLYAELSNFLSLYVMDVPSWCNLKLQQCSINIIQTLHSVCIHIEDVHLLFWADLKIFSIYFLYAEHSHF